VRAAVHSGVVYERDGDMFGTAVNKVARILSVCPPGGVLVSNAVAGLLTDRAPEGVRLERVGEVALAGFTTPEEVHAVVGMGHGPVAVVESEVRRESTLPAIHDELVGRADEVAAIWDAVGRARLVTLVGVGGMGKTRLALEVAAGAVAAYGGAVWWIDLANATSNDATVAVAMAAVGAREVAGRSPLQALCDRFAGVTGLVVVDNCEHVLSAARSMVDALRTARPSVRIVCTSREALGLRGEQVVPVGSLPLGDSVELFVERAGAVRPDLDVVADREVIERICARLDGIPLAVELAAARCRSMTPSDIDERLTDRFRLLRGGRDGAERHRTLQAAVAWSYSLLDADERAVFDQLAVFAGGSLVDGVVAVTGLDEFDVLDVLDRLVARSMVVATRTPLGMRYHQLETLRQFAEDRLVEAGTIIAVRDRHLDWVLVLANSLSMARGLEVEAAAFARFAVEVDNLRVAVAHALEQGRTDTAHAVVAFISGYAWWTPVWEVLDWVRPVPAECRWNPISAICEAIGLAADTQRGLRSLRAETVDDVPDWYGVAPTVGKILFIFNHSLSGGTPAIADELLDGLQPADDSERAQIDGQRMLAERFREEGSFVAAAPVDELVALAERATSMARLSGSAANLAAVNSNASDGLLRHRPDLAERYAREALAIADRLGAGLLSDAAVRGILAALMLSAPSRERLAELHRRGRESLERNRIHAAAGLIWAAVDQVAASDPQLVLRFWSVWKRDFGVDARRLLLEAGVPFPEDPGGLEREVADVSVGDATRAMLAALERLLIDSDGVG
jgi:predicted ATPase